MADREDEKQSNDTITGDDLSSALTRCCGRVYEIVVQGQLADDWSDWLDGLEMTASACGETILCGSIIDQAALLGILNKLNRLNVALLSLRQVHNGK